MKFRLTYEGPLRSTQRDPVGTQKSKHREHKHEIRKVFHKQLRRLWEIDPNLNSEEGLEGLDALVLSGDQASPSSSMDVVDIARRFSNFGHHFVPLVTFERNLICGLDILLLRPDDPGGIYWAGDIDNRIKTLLDALRIPEANDSYADIVMDDSERPFFCLLEDDKLVSHLSVETDQMLAAVGDEIVPSDVRVIITVTIGLTKVTWNNVSFV